MGIGVEKSFSTHCNAVNYTARCSLFFSGASRFSCLHLDETFSCTQLASANIWIKPGLGLQKGVFFRVIRGEKWPFALRKSKSVTLERVAEDVWIGVCIILDCRLDTNFLVSFMLFHFFGAVGV